MSLQQKPSQVQEIPEKVIIEMTPKLYNALKTNLLGKQNALVRSHVNTYFEWLKSIRPEEVVDAVELGITPQDAYRRLGANPIRLGVATVRGFLKAMPRYRAQLKEIATLDLALITLRFENPKTYAVIQRYGKKGTDFVNQWIDGAMQILGIVQPPSKKQEAKA